MYQLLINTLSSTQWVVSIILGIALSLVWGLASWLQWQPLKDDTLIPVGEYTVKYGVPIALTLKGICILVLIASSSLLIWWTAVSVVMMLLIGGWIATLIERKIYCTEELMETLLYEAEKFNKLESIMGTELMLRAVPEWWFKLTPSRWKNEYQRRFALIVFADDDNGNE